MKFSIDELCRLIDHTNLKANATDADMKQLCREAVDYHFKMVAINSGQSARCANYLKGTDINTGAAIGFPLGQTSIAAKCAETLDAIECGANEIDYVINITELKEKNYGYIEKEMQSIVDICREHSVISKVIFENCYLTKDEITTLAKIAANIRPDFIKTSTGMGTGGATAEDIRLMKSAVGDAVAVKASGGIRDAESFIAMIRAGASRIGTSSGIQIINTLKSRAAAENSDTIEI